MKTIKQIPDITALMQTELGVENLRFEQRLDMQEEGYNCSFESRGRLLGVYIPSRLMFSSITYKRHLSRIHQLMYEMGYNKKVKSLHIRKEFLCPKKTINFLQKAISDYEKH